jgi:hypothetical protein
MAAATLADPRQEQHPERDIPRAGAQMHVIGRIMRPDADDAPQLEPHLSEPLTWGSPM